jgi:hypothetical protein
MILFVRKVLTIFLISLWLTSGFAQELPAAYRAYVEKYPEGPPLNHWDSIYLMNIPEKPMPECLRSAPLPPMVDNSKRPYLRDQPAEWPVITPIPPGMRKC